MQAQIGDGLRRCFPEVATVDAASRLGRVLARLTAALDAAEAGRHVPTAFKDDLIGAVPHLRRYARSLTRDVDEADDLVQLTLLKAWAHRTRFEPGTRLLAWLFTILRNGYLNGRLKRRWEVPDPDGVHAAALAAPPGQEPTVGLRELEAAVARLDPAQREALLLVAVEGLSYEAAAEVIGCPRGTVKSRVSRARDRLALELGGG